MTGGWWLLVLALVGGAPTIVESATFQQPTTRAAMRTSGAPAIAYVEGHTLRLPDGSGVGLPKRWRVTGIAAYAGGYLVSDDRVFEGTVGMARLDSEGRVLDQWSGTGPPRVSREGRVAWISLTVAETGRTGPTLIHADSVDGGAEVTQEIDRTRMPFLSRWWRGRLVYSTWGQGSSFLTDLRSRPRAVPIAEDLGERSPDGRTFARVTGDGLEFRHYDGQLLDVVRDRRLTRTQFGDLAWENGRHLLATLTRGGRMCVVRIGADGHMTRATAWRPADTAGFAFLER